MPTTPTFLTVLDSEIAAARDSLRAALAQLAAADTARLLPAPATLERMLFEHVRAPLERLVAPTLALEVNVARLRGELPGDTPAARYTGYVARLGDPSVVAALRAEYPVLFDLATARLVRWVEVSRELIERLVADWPAIVARELVHDDPGPLVAVQPAQRTTKRGGRAVAILAFASGGQLVYKPRSLAVEAHFDELVAWLNDRGLAPTLTTVPLLDRGRYGWMGWVEASPADSAEAVTRFFRRQGAYLALLYALEATDFHLSNVIAAGEHPMLIDLEALFHPRDAVPDWPPLDLALDALTYHSVLRAGLLPEPEPAGEGRFDMGGLTGAAGQLTPYTVLTWRDRDTDAVRLERERRPLGGGRNLPLLDGRPALAIDYLPALEAGFADAYRLLQRHRDTLLAADSPLARFAADEVRVLPRPGQRYSEWLDNSHHPDLLRRPDARAAYFTRRLRADGDDPALAALIPYETAALLAGDVPLFTTQAGSCAVRTHAGAEWPDYFPRAGLDMARRRIRDLNEADLARQRAFIRAAFATVAADEPEPAAPLAVPDAVPAGLAGQFLVEAAAIGEWLAASAVRAGDEASWLGVELGDDGHWALEPLGTDLYNGLPGVALFLAHLGALTGEARWTELAVATVATWQRLADEECAATMPAPIGLFDGLGGQLLALAHLLRLWGDDAALRSLAARLVHDARRALDEAEDHEPAGLARGLAGLLAGLLALHAVAPERDVLAAAGTVGRLLRSATLEPDEPYDRRSPFGAYFDGTAGAAGPLLALAALTGDVVPPIDAPWRAGASADAGAWAAYLAARPWLPDGERQTADVALATALPALLPASADNHALGRGALAWIDLAQTAAGVLDQPWLHDIVARHAFAILADVQREPRTGAPLSVPTPGLMAGLAGIGYGLLRLAAPAAVPSLPAAPVVAWRLA